MISVDKAAIIWSIVIVIVAVEIAAFGNTSQLEHHEDKTMSRAFQTEMENKILSEPSSISFQTDRETYTLNNKILVSGSVSKKLDDSPITLVIINPNEEIITISQVIVDNNRNFSETILIGGQLWEQEGRHVIKVHYGEKNTAETSFNFIPSLLETQFNEIKHQIQQTGYSICNIKLEENKIIIDLNWIFEGSDAEKKIISKIPPSINYEIIYHEGYTDYFINTITGHECDSLEITDKD